VNNQVIDLDSRRPHKVSEVICVKCLHRWIAVRPDATSLKELECPDCAFVGAAIETGETVEE